MSSSRTSREYTGKSPEHDRALEMLRAGMRVYDVAAATGVPHPTIKRWARAAGIAVPAVTETDRVRSQARLERTRDGRRAYDMKATAKIVRR
jgi:hypothetical protein